MHGTWFRVDLSGSYPPTPELDAPAALWFLQRRVPTPRRPRPCTPSSFSSIPSSTNSASFPPVTPLHPPSSSETSKPSSSPPVRTTTTTGTTTIIRQTHRASPAPKAPRPRAVLPSVLESSQPPLLLLLRRYLIWRRSSDFASPIGNFRRRRSSPLGRRAGRTRARSCC